MKTKSNIKNHAASAQGTDNSPAGFYKVRLVRKREHEAHLTVFGKSQTDAMKNASLVSWFPLPLCKWEQVEDSITAESAELDKQQPTKGGSND